jgi:hypothetical protein
MLPNPGERLVLNIGAALTVVPNDDPRRAGISVGATGSLAVASDHMAVVITLSAADWAMLAGIASAVSCALAEREAALARATTLDITKVAGHA